MSTSRASCRVPRQPVYVPRTSEVAQHVSRIAERARIDALCLAYVAQHGSGYSWAIARETKVRCALVKSRLDSLETRGLLVSTKVPASEVVWRRGEQRSGMGRRLYRALPGVAGAGT